VEEFEILMGQSPKGESYNEESKGTLFFQGRAEFTERFPKKRLYTTEPKRLADKFDVLVSVRAPVGDVNVASETCCIGRGLAAVKSQNKSYALYKIKSLKPQFDLFESEGTVFGSINKASFSNMEVIIPPKNKIKDFEKIAYLLDDKYFQNSTQIQTLKQTRDTLLPKLMSGQLRVDEFKEDVV
jgi:type I restriction enzyme S subunit